jgi:hypothetical protein
MTSTKKYFLIMLKLSGEDIQQSNEAWIDEENILKMTSLYVKIQVTFLKSQKQNCGYSLLILMMMMENYQ